MKRFVALVLVALLGACGEDPPERKPPVVEAEVEPEPCVAEELDVYILCALQAASCGELEVEDSCGEPQTIDCGSCGEWEICQRGMCIEEPLEIEGCPHVPDEGNCRDIHRVERCVEGEEGFEVVEEACPSGQVCTMGEEGATCAPLEVSCERALSFCTEEGNLLHCKGGSLVEETCANGCAQFVEEARCWHPPPGVVSHRGSIHYEHQAPRADMSGWAPLERRPAGHLTVLSLSGHEMLDATRVRADGSFEVWVPEEPGESDRLIFVTHLFLFGGETVRVSVVDPELPAGSYPPTAITPEDGVPWSWEFTDIREDYLIPEDAGSAAIQIFQALYAAAAHVASVRGPFLDPPLRGVWAPGVDWSCGACYYWEGGILLSGGAYEVYKSDASILHEAGHWAYDALGVPLPEAGQHCLGSPGPRGWRSPKGMPPGTPRTSAETAATSREAVGPSSMWTWTGVIRSGTSRRRRPMEESTRTPTRAGSWPPSGPLPRCSAAAASSTRR